MNMKLKMLCVSLMGMGVTLLFAGTSVAQDDGHEHGHGYGSDEGEQGEQEAMMEMWAKMSAPGEHHKHLEPFVGRWDYVTKWRMSPEQPWEESRGTAEYKWIMGGRYLFQTVRGDDADDMMGRFEGQGVIGYDNVSKRHFSTWIDSMGTGAMISEGSCDDSGKVLTLTGEYNDGMTGQKKKSKSITRIINSDKHVFEMYDSGPDGKEFQSLEVTYARK